MMIFDGNGDFLLLGIVWLTFESVSKTTSPGNTNLINEFVVYPEESHLVTNTYKHLHNGCFGTHNPLHSAIRRLFLHLISIQTILKGLGDKFVILLKMS